MNSNDIIGIIGVGLILLAYFLNLYNLIKKDGLIYFIMNVAGSLLAAIASYLIHYWPFVILESCWCIISLISLIGIIRTLSTQGNVHDN